MRGLAVLLLGLVLASSCRPAGMSREQRRECRQARTRAALRGFGVTVGVIVVAAVVVVAAAAGSSGTISSGSNSRGSRRRARRRERRRVCRELQRELPEAPARATPALSEVPVRTTETDAARPPPSDEELGVAIAAIENELRACFPPGSTGAAYVDADVDGASGGVTSFALVDRTASNETLGCLHAQLSRLRFHPFQGGVRVRWGVALDFGTQGDEAP